MYKTKEFNMDYSKYIITFKGVQPIKPVRPSLPSTTPTAEQIEEYMKTPQPTKEEMDQYSRDMCQFGKDLNKFHNDKAALMRQFREDVFNELGIEEEFQKFAQKKVNPEIKAMECFYSKMVELKEQIDNYKQVTDGVNNIEVIDIPENERKLLIAVLENVIIKDYEVNAPKTPENVELFKRIQMNTWSMESIMEVGWCTPKDKVLTTQTDVIKYLIKRLGGK